MVKEKPRGRKMVKEKPRGRKMVKEKPRGRKMVKGETKREEDGNGLRRTFLPLFQHMFASVPPLPRGPSHLNGRPVAAAPVTVAVGTARLEGTGSGADGEGRLHRRPAATAPIAPPPDIPSTAPAILNLVQSSWFLTSPSTHASSPSSVSWFCYAALRMRGNVCMYMCIYILRLGVGPMCCPPPLYLGNGIYPPPLPPPPHPRQIFWYNQHCNPGTVL